MYQVQRGQEDLKTWELVRQIRAATEAADSNRIRNKLAQAVVIDMFKGNQTQQKAAGKDGVKNKPGQQKMAISSSGLGQWARADDLFPQNIGLISF